MSARTRALFFCFSLLTHACAGSEEPGAPIWSRLGANASGDGIAFAPDGDVILVGHLSDPTDLGAGLVLDDWAMFVARDSPEGELRWAKTFEGSVFPYGVVVDADDDIFVAGSFRDEVDFGGDELDSGIYDRTSRSQSFIVSFDGLSLHRAVVARDAGWRLWVRCIETDRQVQLTSSIIACYGTVFRTPS